MIRTIASTARIATKIIKDGSVAGRDKFCKKLEDKLYNRLAKYKRTQFDYIGKNLQSILPYKLIQVEKLPQSDNIYNGAVMLAQEAERTIPADVVGYIVSYKNNSKKEHFGGVAIDVLMHEAHHLFNYLTHPKIPSRIFKVSKIVSEYDFQKFFTDNFQSTVKPEVCEAAVKNLISKNDKNKMDLLQYFRYKIIDETGAYNSGKKYLTKYRQKHSNDRYEEYFDQVKVLHLQEKLDLISDMLRQLLKEERQKL